MKKILLMLTLLLIFVSISKPQTIQKNQIVLSGTVTDINSGEPVYCDISIRSEKGKKYKIFSDPITGHYDLLIKGGNKYKFIFYSYNILRQTEEFLYDENTKYREEEKDFKVLRLDKGTTVYEKDLFNANDSESEKKIEKFLKEFKLIMRFHRTVQWDFYISVYDSFEDVSDANAQELLDRRITTWKNKIKLLKAFKSKVNIIPLKINSNEQKTVDIIVKVNKIEIPLNQKFAPKN